MPEAEDPRDREERSDRLSSLEAGESDACAQDEESEADEPLLRQMALSDRLRQMFDHVVDEAVPDDFKDLLARLTDDDEGGAN